MACALLCACRSEHFTTCPGDRPLFVQFCANDPEVFVAAAAIVQVRREHARQGGQEGAVAGSQQQGGRSRGGGARGVPVRGPGKKETADQSVDLGCP